MILPTSNTLTAFRGQKITPGVKVGDEGVGYLRMRTSTGPLKPEDVAYLRVVVTGFEQFVGWENMGTTEKPKYTAVVKPEVAWVTPINKDGTPIEGAPMYSVDPAWLIQPGAVKQDVKDTLGNAENAQ